MVKLYNFVQFDCYHFIFTRNDEFFFHKIQFNYEGYYSQTGNGYEWIPSECCLYTISFKTLSMEEITYLGLVDKICRKMVKNTCTKRLDLSYILLVGKPMK